MLDKLEAKYILIQETFLIQTLQKLPILKWSQHNQLAQLIMVG